MYYIVCIYHILFIYSSADRHLSCLYFSATVNRAALSMGVQLSESLPAIIFEICLEVKLLDHMVILCFIFFGGTTVLFSTEAHGGFLTIQ